MELGTEKETRGILWGEGGNLEGCISYFFEESKILTENSSDTVEIWNKRGCHEGSFSFSKEKIGMGYRTI